MHQTLTLKTLEAREDDNEYYEESPAIYSLKDTLIHKRFAPCFQNLKKYTLKDICTDADK